MNYFELHKTKQLNCLTVNAPFTNGIWEKNHEIGETVFTFALPTYTSSKVKKYKYITKQNLLV